jgi:hypothetical protein
MASLQIDLKNQKMREITPDKVLKYLKVKV